MHITILLSAFFVSLSGLIALFLFRAWELKRGRITRQASVEPIAPRVYEMRHSVKETLRFILLSIVKGVYRAWRFVKRVLHTKTGIGLIKNAVNGKHRIEKKNGSSLYLKDITTHKKEFQNGRREKSEEEAPQKK